MKNLVRVVLVLASLAGALALAPAASAAGTVTVAIQGKGDVSGPSVACSEAGGDCSGTYANETRQECDPERKPPCFTVSEPPYVEFVAGADRNGYVFQGWTGCDAVSGRTCGLFVTDDATVTAGFADNQAPAVSSLVPASGVKRGTIPVSANASDNSGTVSRVDFSVGGVVVSDSTAPYSINFNTASITDGVKSVSATAFDPGGRSATTSSTITVDNTAPAVNVTSGPDGQTYGPGSTQTWAFTASDATSGVAAVQCSLVAQGAPDTFGACSGGSTAHSVANRPEGAHVFKVKVRDAGGLETISAARTFTIDATPPETSITSGPADGASSTATSVTFGFSASQGGSTFECRVYPAALTPPAFGSCTSAGAHTASGFSPGTYAFEVRATDPYTNVDATPAKRTFTVTAPPADPGPGDPTSTGETNTGGTNTGGTSTGGGTTPGGGTAPGGGGGGTTLAPFSPPVTHTYDRKGSRTTFPMLRVRGVPADARLVLSCKPKKKGCKFSRKTVAHKGGTVNLAKVVKTLKLKKGAVLEVQLTSAAGQRKVARFLVRGAKPLKAAYLCAAPGGKLGACG